MPVSAPSEIVPPQKISSNCNMESILPCSELILSIPEVIIIVKKLKRGRDKLVSSVWQSKN